MFPTLTMIATAITAFAVGRLLGWRNARRLRAELADAAWWLAHDPLTGMFNRTGLIAAHATIAEATTAQPIIVILFDLDEFKAVNDTHGHDGGDDLLVETGDRIDEIARLYGGTAARLSGDEYAALLPVRDHDLARLADTFLTLIAQPVELTTADEPTTVTVTASLGVAVAETTDAFEDIALHRADIAMYHAKHHGGNRHVIYEPGMTMPSSQPRRGPRLRDLRQNRRGATA